VVCIAAVAQRWHKNEGQRTVNGYASRPPYESHAEHASRWRKQA
jgi:hypothetical protein